MTYQEMTKQLKKIERLLYKLGTRTLRATHNTKQISQEKKSLESVAGMWKKRPRTASDLGRVRSTLWG